MDFTAKVGKYDKWKTDARKHGMSEKDIQQVVEIWEDVDRCIARGECPDCKSSLHRSVAYSKKPSSDGNLVWYQCSSLRCEFAHHRLEPRTAN